MHITLYALYLYAMLLWLDKRLVLGYWRSRTLSGTWGAQTAVFQQDAQLYHQFSTANVSDGSGGIWSDIMSFLLDLWGTGDAILLEAAFRAR